MATRGQAATFARQASPARRTRSAQLSRVALGAELAREGAAAKTSLGLGVLVALGFSVFVGRLAARPGESAVAEGVALASTALAWAPGVLLIIAASAHTFVRDRHAGVLALLGGHAGGRAKAWRSYVTARTLGLAVTLFALVGGGSVVAAFGAIFGAFAARGRELHEGARLFDALAGAAASLVYGAGFALVLAPLAAATMGARKRARGYGLLYGMLLVPELIVLGSGPDIAAPWRSVLTVPGALAALRSAVLVGLGAVGANGTSDAAGQVDGSATFDAAACALVPLAVYLAVSLFALKSELGRESAS